MAKTIKFNLICDGKPVRTIEDLQNNFSIEDVLEYYNNKLLHRWLEVRKYKNELSEINKISTKEPIKIIKELIKIFDIDSDDKSIEKSIYIFDFLKNRQTLCHEFKKENYEVSKLIKDYQIGYMNLVNGILDNPNNIAKIKANIAEIVKNHSWALQLDHRNLFYLLKDKSTLAIMCLLMNEQSRKYYLQNEKSTINDTTSESELDERTELLKELDEALSRMINESGESFHKADDIVFVKDKKAMYNELCDMITSNSIANLKNDLGENLYVFSDATLGYWKDLESKEKKYMIISIGARDFVRSSGVIGGDLGREDILNKFVLVDGIDYKSNSVSTELLYMEV